MNPLNDVN